MATDDMGNAVRAVAAFTGTPVYRVPDKVTSYEGVPWSMYEALRIAYVAGKEATQ